MVRRHPCLSALLGLLALAAWPLDTSADPAARDAVVGFVAAVRGDVEVRSGGGTFAVASVDGALHPGDELRTGPGGAAKLVFADDSVLMLDASTTLVLDHFVLGDLADGEQSLLKLLRGRVRATIGEAFGGSRLELQTPVATIGVKGTEYEAFHQGGAGGTTRACNLGGSIWVRGAGGTATPGVGRCVFVRGWQAPGRSVPARKAGSPTVDDGYPPLGTAPADDPDIASMVTRDTPANQADTADDGELDGSPIEDVLQSFGLGDLQLGGDVAEDPEDVVEEQTGTGRVSPPGLVNSP